jgi:hypothetical protein
VAIESSGGGDPPCVSSGIVSTCGTGVCAAPPRFLGDLRLAELTRLAVGCRFAAGPGLPLARRFPGVCLFAVVRRFGVAGRLGADRFFRADREIAGRFFRFAI